MCCLAFREIGTHLSPRNYPQLPTPNLPTHSPHLRQDFVARCRGKREGGRPANKTDSSFMDFALRRLLLHFAPSRSLGLLRLEHVRKVCLDSEGGVRVRAIPVSFNLTKEYLLPRSLSWLFSVDVMESKTNYISFIHD